MTAVDHLFIVLLFIVFPAWGAWSWRREVARLRAGATPDRLAYYRQTLVLEWTALAALLAAWLYLERPFAALGFTAPSGWGFWAGGVILLAVVAGLVRGDYNARRADAAAREMVRESVGDLVYFLPNSERTYRRFVGLSITAGICEEIIYRGYLFWYLGAFMPPWAVVLVSSLGFGLGHSYQGAIGVARVTAIGIAFGCFYLLTGSIWLPIIAHAVLDILQGAILREYLSEPTPVQTPDPDPAR